MEIPKGKVEAVNSLYNGQNDKQRSTKHHTENYKDLATRTEWVSEWVSDIFSFLCSVMSTNACRFVLFLLVLVMYVLLWEKPAVLDASRA